MDFEIWWFLAFAVVMTVLVGVYKLAFAFINRHSTLLLTAELEQRLARIEHATESTAIEVERIGENQRFLTRALGQQPVPEPVAKPAPVERVITPH